MTATDRLVDFATTKLNDAINAVEKVLPTATKYVLQITSLNCMMNLLPLIALIPLAGFWCWINYRWFKFCREEREDLFWMVFLLGQAVTVGLAVAISVILLDGWNWVCIFRPDLYLVHLAVQKVLAP